MFNGFVCAVLLVAGLVGGVGTEGAGAESARVAGGDAITRYRQGRIEVPLILSAAGSITYGAVRAVSFATDSSGHVDGGSLSNRPIVSGTEVSTTRQQTNTSGCIYSSRPAGLVIYAPLFVTQNDASEYVYYIFSPYLYRHARTLGGVGQNQFEMCVKGGSSTSGGWKQDRTGGSLFLRARSLRMIGWSWASGASLSTVSATLGFQVGSKRSAASISGSITVDPTDRNTGAQGRIDWDPGNPANSYPYNADHGWWQTGCSGWRWCGVTNYEGAVVHGLWEFPAHRFKRASFTGTAEWQLHCSRPFGWGCS